MLGRTIRTLLEMRQETEVHFLVGTVILVFLSISMKIQAPSSYEALNSMFSLERSKVCEAPCPDEAGR